MGDYNFNNNIWIDINNILKVTAIEIGNNKRIKELTIKCYNDRLSENEIQRLIKESEIMKNED